MNSKPKDQSRSISEMTSDELNQYIRENWDPEAPDPALPPHHPNSLYYQPPKPKPEPDPA